MSAHLLIQGAILALIGIAMGRAQAQYPMGTTRDSAESAPNHRHLPEAQQEARLNLLSFADSPYHWSLAESQR